MTVRPRTDADIGACLDLVRLVHATDGYPHHLPADLRAFLVSRDACAAWVAEHEGRVTGHIALHRRSSEPVMALASAALRQPAGRLAVIGRLLVSPHARGAGTGRALLAAASAEAGRRGLWPVLDVVTDLHPAIRLYERCGLDPGRQRRSPVPQRNHPGGVRLPRPAPGCLILVPIRAVMGDQVTGRRCCTESRRELRRRTADPR